MRLNIKPLSVNEAYTGKRYKTKKYKRYKMDLLMILPRIKIPSGKLAISITWGFSNEDSDIDNCCKAFIDCLQSKYGFNDKMIYKLNLEKTIVPKGQDFIEWSITSAE